MTHPLFGMTVRQSPVWASQTRICPARQQLASSIPSLAKHSMSCETDAECKPREVTGSRIRSLSFNVKMLPSSDKILTKLLQLISLAAARLAEASSSSSSFSVVFKSQQAEFLCSFKSR